MMMSFENVVKSAALIVTAVAFSRGGSDGSLMPLAIYCRGGRTELVVEGPAIAGKGDEYAISYRIDDNDPVQVVAGRPSFGTGAAFKGDIVRLLQSLPEEGSITVRISPERVLHVREIFRSTD